jgi:hypothetical protein
MKRLDIAVGEWVKLRNGRYATVTEHSKDRIKVMPARLNGFKQVLFWDYEYELRANGTKRDIPSPEDVVNFVDWVPTGIVGFFLLKGSEEPKCVPIKFIEE